MKFYLLFQNEHIRRVHGSVFYYLKKQTPEDIIMLVYKSFEINNRGLREMKLELQVTFHFHGVAGTIDPHLDITNSILTQEGLHEEDTDGKTGNVHSFIS